MDNQRHLLACVVGGGLLLAGEAASAQPAPETPSPLQSRVQELARSLRDSPRLKNLTEQQRIERVEFVIGNTLFVLLHEMGHLIIDEMKLPVLGRLEDTADTFAALRMLTVGTSFALRGLSEASKGWFLNDRRDQQTGAKPLYFLEHNLSQQRAYQIVCLMVGSDPDKFKSLADEAKMPKARQDTCKEDYARAAASWEMVLKPHHRAADQPPVHIDVIYHESEGRLAGFARAFREIRMLEAVAQRAANDFAWPAPFALEMKECGRPEAAWNDETNTLRICYDIAYDFAELYRAYVYDAPAQPSRTQARRQSSNKTK